MAVAAASPGLRGFLLESTPRPARRKACGRGVVVAVGVLSDSGRRLIHATARTDGVSATAPQGPAPEQPGGLTPSVLFLETRRRWGRRKARPAGPQGDSRVSMPESPEDIVAAVTLGSPLCSEAPCNRAAFISGPRAPSASPLPPVCVAAAEAEVPLPGRGGMGQGRTQAPLRPAVPSACADAVLAPRGSCPRAPAWHLRRLALSLRRVGLVLPRQPQSLAYAFPASWLGAHGSPCPREAGDPWCFLVAALLLDDMWALSPHLL